jgi:hypothetical protein
MYFPYLKSHTILGLQGDTTTTVANIAAATAAYVAKELLLDTASAYGKGKYQDFYKAVAIASVTTVHAAITLPDTGTTVVTTGITDPGHYRCISIKGSAAEITGDVVIAGTDWTGAVITDTLAANDDDTVVSEKAFMTVTSITVPVKTTAADTISVGVADVFGLTRPVAVDTDVLYVGFAADAVNASTFTYEDAASVDTDNNTVTLTTGITALDDLIIDFYASAL